MNAHTQMDTSAAQIIKQMVAKVEHRRALRLLMKEVCAEVGMSKREVMGRSRFRHIVRARWEFMRRARNAGYKFEEIATFLGMDHTTVIHGVREWEAILTEART